MKILIGETDPNIRYGLNLLLEQVEDRITMDEVTNSQELLRCVKASSPDVLLISQVFPGLDNGGLLEELQQVCPNLTIIVMKVNPTMKEIEMPAHFNLNLSAEYRYSKILSLWAKFNNISFMSLNYISLNFFLGREEV